VIFWRRWGYLARVPHPNTELIERFYAALNARDPGPMVAAYRDDATFSDPVFPHLDAAGVRAMWSMFCAPGADLKVVASGIDCNDSEGRAHWDATYTFSATKRHVENRIDARFTFKDGKILTHVDTFDFWRWSRQALGAPGLFLGWSPIVKNKVRGLAGKSLRKFQATGSR
jgi:ketosteroid isomerase-like protein